MGRTLFEKVWEAHTVRTLPNGQTQLLIGTHLIHEVTSPQAFGMLRDLGLRVKFPHRTFATVDHIVPTDNQNEPFADPQAAEMIAALRRNVEEFDVTYFDLSTGKQGIVHVVGPEQGITQPGTTIACGDSHTATHGAFGAIAFGIGTTQVRDVLATQTIAIGKLKVRRINVEGRLGPGVYAKDVILHIIAQLGAKGGIGYAYEYGGEVIDRFSIEERMTVCNMSIEGGARCGYVNPDEKTFAYLEGRPYCPQGTEWEEAVERWRSFASDEDAVYDDVVTIEAEDHRTQRDLGDLARSRRADLGIDPPVRGDAQRGRAIESEGSARLHEARSRHANQGDAHRRRLRRLVHQRTSQRFPGSGEVLEGQESGAARQGDRRPRQPGRGRGVREGGDR